MRQRLLKRHLSQKSTISVSNFHGTIWDICHPRPLWCYFSAASHKSSLISYLLSTWSLGWLGRGLLPELRPVVGSVRGGACICGSLLHLNVVGWCCGRRQPWCGAGHRQLRSQKIVAPERRWCMMNGYGERDVEGLTSIKVSLEKRTAP
jgi:hypothetical protein